MTYEQGLLDGAKLMFKMLAESLTQLQKNLFEGVDSFNDIEHKIKEREDK